MATNFTNLAFHAMDSDPVPVRKLANARKMLNQHLPDLTGHRYPLLERMPPGAGCDQPGRVPASWIANNGSAALTQANKEEGLRSDVMTIVTPY